MTYLQRRIFVKKSFFKSIIYAFFLSIAIVIVFNSINVKAISLFYEEENKAKVILIDPGHGGYDGGAVSKNGTIEKDINLSISIKLKKQLEKLGYKVYMTREEDESLNSIIKRPSSKKVEDLNNRCKMKKELNCDMFISIHQNTFPKSNVHGAQVWYSKYEESKILAAQIQKFIIEMVDPSNKRIEKPALDNYRILRDGYEAPSVLVECGFITNLEEEKKLKDEAYQEKIASAIAEGVKKYYEEIGQKNSAEQ